MLSKKEVLRLLTALARMNDSDLLSRDEGLPPEVCAPEDRRIIREIRALLLPLRQSLNYADSPEFRDLVGGKSTVFEAMQKKLAADPNKRRAYSERVDQALEGLLDSDDAFRVLPEGRHQALTLIRQLARTLRNPE